MRSLALDGVNGSTNLTGAVAASEASPEESRQKHEFLRSESPKHRAFAYLGSKRDAPAGADENSEYMQRVAVTLTSSSSL